MSQATGSDITIPKHWWNQGVSAGGGLAGLLGQAGDCPLFTTAAEIFTETMSPSTVSLVNLHFIGFPCLNLVCKFALVLLLYKSRSWKEFYIRPHVSNLTINNLKPNTGIISAVSFFFFQFKRDLSIPYVSLRKSVLHHSFIHSTTNLY